MEQKTIPSSLFGLVGARLEHSFSRAYFSQKFEELELTDHEYRNFEVSSEEELFRFRESVTYDKDSRTTKGRSEILRGFNVTIPYKQTMLKIVDHVSEEAKAIGAINTVVIEDNVWTGHNTDAYGFGKSLKPFLPIKGNALILGTGGASNAVAYTLESLQIPYLKVSRSPQDDHTIDYKSLNKDVISQVQLIINTTPVGTHPNNDQCPAIPYEYLTENHILYDLVYNPSLTLFMKKGQQQGARAVNGYLMLVQQAEKAWKIWNK